MTSEDLKDNLQSQDGKIKRLWGWILFLINSKVETGISPSTLLEEDIAATVNC